MGRVGDGGREIEAGMRFGEGREKIKRVILTDRANGDSMNFIEAE